MENETAKTLRNVEIGIVVVLLLAAFYAGLVYLGVASGNAAESIVLQIFAGIIIIEIIGIAVQRFVGMGANKVEAKTIRTLFRVLAYIILIVFIFYKLNVDITGLLVSAGFLGIVFGLAAQSTLSNFIAGVYLLTSGVFEPGDRVTIHTWQYTLQPQSYPHDKFIPGFTGVIKTIGLLYTELENDEAMPVYVPNNVVVQALVINYRRARENIIKMQFDINTKVPFDKLKAIISRELRAKRIRWFKIDIEYLHNEIYVITVHLESEFKGRADLKSAIYGSVIDYMNTVDFPKGRKAKRRGD